MTSGTTAPVGISVVIPTRNRQASLERVLDCLNRQEFPVLEVLIVDASDPPADRSQLSGTFRSIPITVIPSYPHVCVQRNIGIRKARGSHVFLCDDDIEIPADYTRRVVAHLNDSSAPVAVSGILTEPDHSGVFDDGSRSLSVSSLLSSFFFQHGLWGDVDSVRAGIPASVPLSFLKWYFRKRNNTFSLAGWPLFTQIRYPFSRTAVYGLGAAVVPREWLLQSPYDETLDTHGIGDNYGVSLGFPGKMPIAVLPDLAVKHHKEPGNRLHPDEVYRLRVLALYRYVSLDPRFGILTRVFLVWSLFGRFVVMALAGNTAMRNSAGRAIREIVAGPGKPPRNIS
ncbi:MAG: glycosyltransferase family 2 protein [Ignavibacteria bacterium]|nr:glycosyltransferase family 2 protein [Ignavibacteria bacterium]